MSEIAKPTAPAQRSTLQLESDMAATRERLVGTIAEIEDKVKPANVAKRGKEQVKAFFQTESGGVHWQHVGMVAGGAVATVVALRVSSRSVRWLFGAPSRKARVVYVNVPAPAVTVAAPAPVPAITAA